MMLHRFERVSVLTDEVSEMESNAVKVSALEPSVFYTLTMLLNTRVVG